MNVGAVMTPAVVSVEANQSVAEATQLMGRYNIGFLPIVEGGTIRAAVSDRDIALKVPLTGRAPDSIPVGTLTSPGVVWCQTDTSIEDAVAIMQAFRVRRLLVTDERQRPVGVFTLGDLARRTDLQELAGRTLARIIDEQQRWGKGTYTSNVVVSRRDSRAHPAASSMTAVRVEIEDDLDLDSVSGVDL